VSQAHCVAAGWSLKTFLALRVASGACAGASPVVKAYLADAASQEDLPQWMAWREASCTLAFIVGPTLGGLLFHGSSLHACIAVTGWASGAEVGDGRRRRRVVVEEDGRGRGNGNGPGPSVTRVR
jgi:MFS family permease